MQVVAQNFTLLGRSHEIKTELLCAKRKFAESKQTLAPSSMNCYSVCPHYILIELKVNIWDSVGLRGTFALAMNFMRLGSLNFIVGWRADRVGPTGQNKMLRAKFAPCLGSPATF